eukprot:CAMPEP_0118632032 /NCGR_PEP_ID=MMETSP0785-20121206/222_1 /TAXON_ID=91992 /ORGANISM="Bolidomonas pacifica, Strain CCMP 1866" /LENGTH=281 /DNA_ID=CAMNT_0006522763 /DNA_START=573 /DNA_END=1418 /DNA_ORIENTATION=-
MSIRGGGQDRGKVPKSRPAITHVHLQESQVCDASLGIKLKWEDDDYDVDPQKAAREGIKKRCPKEDVHCRAPFAKPKSVKVKKVVDLQDLGKFDSDKRACITSLPVEACLDYLPYLSTKKYRKRFEAFRDEIFGKDYSKAMTKGYIAVHLRRGDRCGHFHKKHSNIYQAGACGDITHLVSKIRRKVGEGGIVYIATDSEEPNVIEAIRKAGFYQKHDIFGAMPQGVMFDDELLTDLDIFLIELDMMNYAKSAYVLTHSNAVVGVVSKTRKWLGLSSVETIL